MSPQQVGGGAEESTETVGAVGFIGLGNIGGPMAGHLVEWPGGLVVSDLRAEATEPFAEKGATVASSAAEVAASCDVVSIMVLDDAQVRMVTDEMLTTARAGTVIAVHSTVRPETAIDVAARAAEAEVHVVDAPVSGGFMGAHDGRLAVMVGGSEEAFARVKEPFSCWAEVVIHAGEVGTGTRFKIARNLITFVSYCAAGEAQRLAEACGISLRDLGNVVRFSDTLTGGPGAIIVRDDAGPMAPDDGLRTLFEHSRVLGEKDLVLALELGADMGVDMPLTRIALDRLGTELGLS